MYDLDIPHGWDLYNLNPSYMFTRVRSVGSVGSANVYLGGICMICMIYTCFAEWDLYDLKYTHNFSI